MGISRGGVPEGREEGFHDPRRQEEGLCDVGMGRKVLQGPHDGGNPRRRRRRHERDEDRDGTGCDDLGFDVVIVRRQILQSSSGRSGHHGPFQEVDEDRDGGHSRDGDRVVIVRCEALEARRGHGLDFVVLFVEEGDDPRDDVITFRDGDLERVRDAREACGLEINGVLPPEKEFIKEINN